MKRISRIITCLCLLLLLCSPVWAQHTGPYVGGFAGGSLLMDSRSSDSQGDFTLKFKPELLGSAVIGWDLAPGTPVGEGRIELEYSHRSNQLDQIKFAEGNFKGSGNVTSDSLLINFIGVLRDKRPWSPYAVVGIGAARIEADGLQVDGHPMGKGSDNVLAYQLGVGFDFTLTDYLSLDLGYRFFSSTRPQFKEVSGHNFGMAYMSHNAVLGLRFGF